MSDVSGRGSASWRPRCADLPHDMRMEVFIQMRLDANRREEQRKLVAIDAAPAKKTATKPDKRKAA
jgi:hypothetical protein